ncbi:uncharacterized protein LOC141850742 [Brevipalpus obovatus]|uniref:uncharacterized protein LOC141850742 n=1 Tax=Brevipalpus obovatus TaxID=246614 RepID=UPI003D9ECB08
MIKSIVLLATFLAVVVANPQGLLRMADDDPLLIKLATQAFEVYNFGSGIEEKLIDHSEGRSTQDKKLVKFDLEMKGTECNKCSCSEYIKVLPVQSRSRYGTEYMFIFGDERKVIIKKFEKC